jgi:very-short-patch-repair endonuclease
MLWPRRGGFGPDRLLHFAAHYPRARGVARLAEALACADARAGSPMESRLRMLLVLAGLPRPGVQYPVQDPVRRRAVWLDLAYPDHRIGIEYEGAEHTEPDRVLRDAGRYTRLVDAGWRIYRYTEFEISRERDRIVAEITRAMRRVKRTPRRFGTPGIAITFTSPAFAVHLPLPDGSWCTTHHRTEQRGTTIEPVIAFE